MAEKKEEVAKVPTKNQVIDTSIDMKLSKQDLIDVVVEETRDNLQLAVDNTRDAYEIEKAKVDKAFAGLNKIFKAAIEKKYTAELKLLEAHGGAEKRDAYVGNGRSNGLVATETGIIAAKELRHENVRNSRGHWSNRLVDDNGNIVNIKYDLPDHYDVSNRSQDIDEDDDEGGKVVLKQISISLTLRLSNSEGRKLFADFGKQVKALGAIKAELANLEEQLRNVDKMGKKAKTQLIKRILESSEGGQALLTNVSAIKANVGQLLLEATK